MIVHGAYFRDEVMWRGRIVAAIQELTTVLYTLGFLISVLYLGVAISKWWGNDLAMIGVGAVVCFAMLGKGFDSGRDRKAIDREISRYFDERYQNGPP